MDEKEVLAAQVLKTSPPTNIKKLRKLLGFLGYYRSYVQNFSQHAKCLYDLLSVDTSPDLQPKPKTQSVKGGQPAPSQKIV